MAGLSANIPIINFFFLDLLYWFYSYFWFSLHGVLYLVTIWCFFILKQLPCYWHIYFYISQYNNILYVLSLFSLNKLKTMKKCIFIVFNICIMTCIFFTAFRIFKLLSLVLIVCLNFLFVFHIRQICYPFCSIRECLCRNSESYFYVYKILAASFTSIVSDSVRPHGLYSSRLLCPWGFSRQKY